ncbi:MAG: T9SS type A sorting domain-containing protein [Lishizhenia sp.]
MSSKVVVAVYFLWSIVAMAQTIPQERLVDWTLAGLRDTTTSNYTIVDMSQHGVVGDGITPNDGIIENIYATIFSPGIIFKFPAGNFLFNETINLQSRSVLRGEGAEATIFSMNLNGSGHAIRMQGNALSSDTSNFLLGTAKNDSICFISNSSIFQSGDWVRLIQDDSDWITSTWAENRVGQIMRVKTINNQEVTFESPFRMNYSLNRNPYLQKIQPLENSGVECLKIVRLDDTAPEQTSSIFFNYATNCWVIGVESENCTFSHIGSYFSSNLKISQSYFHHAFGYGGGGRAYGVMFQSTTNESLVENNVFEHLRHSMILQSGANGNVFAYNYSFDPFWESIPSNSAGDLVLHGNYPYANLFEGNICQNIVIDNSHGPNGLDNLIFRNRAEGYGVFFSADNSPGQLIVGNEITNLSFPYNLVNYTIQGNNHFLFGNNNKGVIDPVGTENLIDTSYAYKEQPPFLFNNTWFPIGTPHVLGVNSIPAYMRAESNTIMQNACSVASLSTSNNYSLDNTDLVFTNPIYNQFRIKATENIEYLTIYTVLGELVFSTNTKYLKQYQLETTDWKNGLYFVQGKLSSGSFFSFKTVKIN